MGVAHFKWFLLQDLLFHCLDFDLRSISEEIPRGRNTSWMQARHVVNTMNGKSPTWLCSSLIVCLVMK
jgi:hypothetical protein